MPYSFKMCELAALDNEVEPNIEALWFAEAERRLEELRSGKVEGIQKQETGVGRQ